MNKKLILGIVFSLNCLLLAIAIIVGVKNVFIPASPVEKIPLKVPVQAPEIVPSQVKEKETAAWISINSNPAKAKVFINGYFKGVTPVDLKIVSVTEVPRTFSVKVVYPGYLDWEKNIVLKRGDTQEFSINLIKK